MPSVSVFCKGAMMISRTLMGPYGMDRTVYCMEFNDCINGLGIKVIGGLREFSREEYGVYVKRILPGGVAYSDGRLLPGDQILEVNGESLIGVSNDRAVDILRMSSATGYMRLLIARDEEARKEFSELLEKCSSHSDTGSSRSSPILHSSRYLESTSSESSSRSQSPLLLSPASSHSQFGGSSGVSSYSTSSDLGVQNISIHKSTGLGLVLSGGSNRQEGPMVYVQEVLPDGDSYRDGRLRSGDQLLSINQNSMIGITNEEAKRIVARARFRQNSCTDVSFIPNSSRLRSSSVSSSSSLLQHRMVGNGLSPCRLKVHVRSPECRHENNVPSPSPDICPPELTISAPSSPTNHRSSASKQKVSLDPHVRIKEEKLDFLLEILGMEISDAKRRELHHGLITDCQGTVAYGDLLQALRDGLQEELEDAGLDSSSLLFTHYEAANLLDTCAFHSPVTKEFDVPRFFDSLDLEKLQDEVSELKQEMRRLKVLLREAENSKKEAEEDLQKISQKVTGLLSENRCLQNKLQMAELAQRQAHSAEHDYEEVIHLLEAEISELKSQMSGKKKLMAIEVQEGMDLNRRLSLSDCQLRKSEVTRKHLEVSNKKLLNFVQKMQKILSTSLQLDAEKGSEDVEDGPDERPLNVCLPSARTLVTEVTDILESCTACPFSCGDFHKYNQTSYQPGPSSRKVSWPTQPSPLSTHNLSRSEEVLYTAKRSNDQPKAPHGTGCTGPANDGR
ncbi:syntaxin-binding protein 4-like isoform 1-T1 [Anomaloglossus baeobatrachus]|uniref:syntaxin-binding protein 4-like isoform X1 n=2 Tax=Anomaloglossus baeobatrachus TaxID=238106 RepID=UPI003F50AF7E